MNIQQIKAAIGSKHGFDFQSMDMVRQLTESAPDAQGNTIKTPQPWLSHWDNDRRIRVSMHEDIFKQIVANKDMEGLAIKHELVPAKLKADNTVDRAAYDRYVVIKPTGIEATF